MAALEKVSVKQNGTELNVRLSGVIDENVSFAAVNTTGVKVIQLDLEGVLMLNSMGLRAWVLWAKTLPKGIQFFVRNCPRCVVDQINILSGLLPAGALVESFYVPYSCGECGHEENFLATRGRDYVQGTVDQREGVKVPHARPCPKCAKSMEIDVAPQKYFNFLKYRP